MMMVVVMIAIVTIFISNSITCRHRLYHYVDFIIIIIIVICEYSLVFSLTVGLTVNELMLQRL